MLAWYDGRMEEDQFIAEVLECAWHLNNGHLMPADVARRLEDIAERMRTSKVKAATTTASLAAMGQRIDSCVNRLDVNEHDFNVVAARLVGLRQAMRELAAKEALHPSVRHLADTIALNLSAQVEEVQGG
jgi:hypothetical protein